MAPRALAGGGRWAAQDLRGEGLSPSQLATRSDISCSQGTPLSTPRIGAPLRA